VSWLGRTTEQRFWSKVDKRGPDECWPWTAASIPGGWGYFYLDRRPFPAYRWSYERPTVPFPMGLSSTTFAGIRLASTRRIWSR